MTNESFWDSGSVEACLDEVDVKELKQTEEILTDSKNYGKEFEEHVKTFLAQNIKVPKTASKKLD
eukprot:909442-Lingulodinium_polyedra.AAC.1